MNSRDVMRVTTALDLQHHIVGVKYLDFKEDFEACKAEVAEKKGSFCFHVRAAMDGAHYIVNRSHVTCDYARAALGLEKPDVTLLEGRSYEYCGLYKSRAVAKDIAKTMKYIQQDIYGLEMGPLKEMESADIVIIADFADAIMRIMQGYSYIYGAPKNLCFYGNQAMCSDMMSKPFSNNDINISLMCRGTRNNGRFNKGELSVAFPEHMFDNIVEGIIQTINPVHSPKDKKRIAEMLETPEQLGIVLNEKYNYGMGLKEYDLRVARLREESKNL